LIILDNSMLVLPIVNILGLMRAILASIQINERVLLVMAMDTKK
jgi:hypothetical protein